jgi:hypothetical protein
MWMEVHMPGDPKECRVNAICHSRLADGASNAETRMSFAVLAETWSRLAAELESEQALINTLSELEFGEPCYVLPVALRLKAA